MFLGKASSFAEASSGACDLILALLEFSARGICSWTAFLLLSRVFGHAFSRWVPRSFFCRPGLQAAKRLAKRNANNAASPGRNLAAKGPGCQGNGNMKSF